MVRELLSLFLNNAAESESEIELKDHFFNLDTYFTGMDKLLLGLHHDAALAFDREVASALTNFLFANNQPPGSDLIAR